MSGFESPWHMSNSVSCISVIHRLIWLKPLRGQRHQAMACENWTTELSAKFHICEGANLATLQLRNTSLFMVAPPKRFLCFFLELHGHGAVKAQTTKEEA
jgi:hypothetical protein